LNLCKTVLFYIYLLFRIGAYIISRHIEPWIRQQIAAGCCPW